MNTYKPTSEVKVPERREAQRNVIEIQTIDGHFRDYAEDKSTCDWLLTHAHGIGDYRVVWPDGAVQKVRVSDAGIVRL